MTLAKARELAVLSLIRAHPAHGYDISRALAEGSLTMLGLSRPAVYAILDRFSKRGWISGETQSSGRRPDKTVMHLTDAGAKALKTMQGDASSLAALPVVPLMALLLAHDAGQTLPRAALLSLLDDRQARLASLEADSTHVNSATATLARRVLLAEIETLSGLC